MKKIIKRFWGVAFVLVLLSTLLVGAVPQAAAMNYLWFNSFATPGSLATDITLTPTTGYSILDIAQSGSTIVVTTTENITNTARLYRSTDGGVTWAQVIPTTAPAAGNWTRVALAPDDPNIIAIVSTDPNMAHGGAVIDRPCVVWLSKDGGNNFFQLGNLAAGAWINDIAIAPKVGGISRVTVGGNTAAANSANNVAGNNGAYLVTWPLNAVAPTWTAPTGWAVGGLAGATDDVPAVAYSPNYLADYALMVVTDDIASAGGVIALGDISLHCYSYNTNQWDALVEATFPRILENANSSANVTVCNKAQIVLDPNFFLGDEAQQIGFIGTSITNNVTGEIGGVYRLDYTSVGGANLLYQIYTGAVNSVAWDGTNLMSADRVVTMGVLTVRRSANALSPLPTFSPNSIYKTPGTGNDTKLLFSATSGTGFAVSKGNGSAIAKSTDYGKTFNGYKLVNSHFGNLMDWWISPSGSVMYVLTTDNVDVNLWKGTMGFGYAFERVFMINHLGTAAIGGVGGDPTYMVRADKDNPDNVYIGLRGNVNLFKSTDGGVNWTARSCSQNIRDFAVQDANTVYVAVNAAGTVVKSESGGLSWTDPPLIVLPAAGGTCSSLNLLSDNNLLLGGTLGGVGYTTDGSTWTYIGAPIFGAFGGGFSVVDATGLAAGDMIFVGNGFELATWTIGTSFMFNENIVAGAVNGLVYTNGIVYTYDVAANDLHRWLYPTSAILGAGIAASTDVVGNPGANFNNVGQPIINPLKATTGSTTLWARNANDNKGTIDTLNSYTEYLIGPGDSPTTVYPTSDTIIPINSINGAVAAFNFVFDAPPSIAITGVLVNYNYNIQIYLDEAGTNPFAGSAVNGVLAANSSATQLSWASPGGYAPGSTYYWRVRVDRGAPLESYWAAMESFTVQQLVAVVPVINSPENGSEVNTTTPGFSWSPIENTTGYRFELATDADFTDVIYTVDTTSAGAAVPSTMALTRGAQYFWRVKALTPLEGEWSTTANFIVAELPVETTPVTITTAPQPTITNIIEQPQATTTTIVVPPAEEKVVNPSYIWAIIVVGAVLVIAVIILIVRTRRTV
jgi:hypothetical protein